MNELKVAIMVYGTEDISTQINEWKSFVESNSKFTISIIEKRELELTYIPKSGENCYFALGGEVNHLVIPKEVHIITLLWKLLEGQNPCMAGGTLGGDYGIHNRPYTSIPYNVYWWDESYTHEGFNTHGAQIITHEFQNALRWMLQTELGFPALPDPYAGACEGINLAECYKLIFSAITDEMYSAIDEMFPQRIRIASNVEYIRFCINGDYVPSWKEVSEPTWTDGHLLIRCVGQDLSDKEYYADAYATDIKVARADLSGTASERECYIFIEKEKLIGVSAIELHLVNYKNQQVASVLKNFI